MSKQYPLKAATPHSYTYAVRHLPEVTKMDSRFWELFYGAGVLLYNVLHGSYSYSCHDFCIFSLL